MPSTGSATSSISRTGQGDIVGHPCRFGMFADGRLSWIDSPEWERPIGYEPDALVTYVTLIHREFRVVLHMHAAADFHENILRPRCTTLGAGAAVRLLADLPALQLLAGLTPFTTDPWQLCLEPILSPSGRFLRAS